MERMHPFVQRVEVSGGSDGMMKYLREWTQTGDQWESPGASVNSPLDAGGYTMHVLFSQPMAPGVGVNLGGLRDIPLALDTPDDLGVNYRAIFSVGGESGLPDGFQRLSFTGYSKENIPLMGLSSTWTVITAADLSSAAYAGPDIAHSLTVNHNYPVIHYNTVERHYVGYDYDCVKACGGVEAPIYIHTNSGAFQYSDEGGEVKKVRIYRNSLSGSLFFESDYIINGFPLNCGMPIPDGYYVQTVTDNLGLTTVMYFVVETKSPELHITGMGGLYDVYAIEGQVSDATSGMDYLSIGLGETRLAYSTITYGQVLPQHFEFSGLSARNAVPYFLTAQDRAGNWVNWMFMMGEQPLIEMKCAGCFGTKVESVEIIQSTTEACNFSITSTPGKLYDDLHFNTMSSADGYAWNGFRLSPEITSPRLLSGNVDVKVDDVCVTDEDSHITTCHKPCSVKLKGHQTRPVISSPETVGPDDQAGDGQLDVTYTLSWAEVIFRDLRWTPGVTPVFRYSEVTPPAPPTDYVTVPPDRNKGYDIKIDNAVYDEMNIRVCGGFPPNLTDSDLALMRFLHYKDNGDVSDISTGMENGCANGTAESNSVFSVIAPARVYDKTGPFTYLSGRINIMGEIAYVAPTSTVGITAADNSYNPAVLAGVATIYYLLDTPAVPECLQTAYNPGAPAGSCANKFYAAPFSLLEGTHTVYSYSTDNFGNTGLSKTWDVRSDGTPPWAQMLVNGASITTKSVYIEDASTISMVAGDIESRGVSSGLLMMLALLDVSTSSCTGQPDFTGPPGTCRNPVYAGPFSLSVGSHTVAFSAFDGALNQSPQYKVEFTVLPANSYLDSVPPVSDISFLGEKYGVEPVYISSSTGIVLRSSDSMSGVAGIYYAIDAASFTVYSGTFSVVAEGPHTVRYYSADLAGNIEEVRISSVTVDISAPEAAAAVNGETVIGTAAYAVSGDSIALTAVDAGSGVRDILYVVDSAFSVETAVVYEEPFLLDVGTHTVSYAARDNVGNQAEIKTFSLTVTVVSSIEAPTGIYFDEVGADRIVASAYAPVFTGLSGPVAGINIAKDGEYGEWHVNGGVWTSRAPMTRARGEMGAVSVGGKIYVIGGYNWTGFMDVLSDNDEYDPVSDSWSTKAPMPTKRGYVFGAVSGGKIYAIGGYDGGTTVFTVNEEYDPETNSWRRRADIPTMRSGVSAVGFKGKVYVIGGSGHSGPNALNEVYDPKSDTWETKAPMPTARHELCVTAARGRIYAIGGANQSGTVSANEAYDPETDTWERRADMPQALSAGAGGVVGGKIYMVSGWKSDNYEGTTSEEYDPATDVWRYIEEISGTRAQAGGVAAGGRLYIFGGWHYPNHTTWNDSYDPGVASVFSGLTPNTLYEFKAKARDGAGIETAESTATAVYTLAAQPGIGEPAYTIISGTEAALNWQANGNPDGTLYRAELSTGAEFTGGVSQETNGLTAVFGGLEPGGIYYGRVAARNNAGEWTAARRIAEIYSDASTQTVNGQPEIYASAGRPITIAQVDTSTGIGSMLLGAAITQGIQSVSNVYDVGPENVVFSPPLLLVFRYSTNTLAGLGVLEEDVYLYHYEPDGTLVKVPDQVRDPVRREITVRLSQLASIFAIFGESRDNVPPVTELSVVNGGYFKDDEWYTNTVSSISLTAYDPIVYATASGVAFTEYRVGTATDTPAFTLYTQPFGLAAGRHIVEFRSQDMAGNLEAVKSSIINVTAPSNIAARLDYPWPGALGVEQAVGGKVSILGEVSGEGVRSWTLSVAAGSSTGTGFSTITAGTAAISGRLALWDASRLTGWHTVKLAAIDASDTVSISSAAVFVGRPEPDFTIGSRGSAVKIKELKGPEGIVVRPDGKIWAAVDDTDKLLLISPEGALIASIGGRTGPLRLKNPRGLSLDAAGNLYAADRGNNRVIKLSPDGSQLLKEFKTDLSGPNDAAVSGDGSVFVADTEHSRVRVFNADGTVLRDIPTGRHSRPWGLALTEAGLWVSERGSRTAQLYTREGVPLKTLPDIGRVRGAAVDRGGALYIADRTNDRIDKFDPEGRRMLSVGPKSMAWPWERAAMRYLSDPSDAAIGPDGSLWVADSGHDRLVKFVLPAGDSRPGYGHRPSAAPEAQSDETAEEAVDRTIDPVDGGKVELDDGTAVRIPPGAVSEGITVTVRGGGGTTPSSVSQKEQRRQAHSLGAVSREIDYGPAGAIFNAPVTLILAYDPARLAALNIKEGSLKVYYWDPTAGDWTALESVVDAEAGVVSAQTMHFSVYQVMAEGVTVQATADAAFRLGEVYVYPNPAKGGAKPTFHIETGIADSVKLKVFTVSGEQAHEHTIGGTPDIINDGNGPSYAYEYIWDGHIPSGVYYYAIEARQGGRTLKKAGKFAVIR